MAKKKTETAEELLDNYILGHKKREDLEPIESSKTVKYIDHNMALMEMPEIELTDRQKVKKRVKDYFELCRRNEMKPSLPGLALAFRLSRDQFLNIVRGRNKNVPRWLSDEFNLASLVLNSQMEDYMQNGQINPVSAIFLLKNHYSYVDSQNIIVTPGQIEEDIPEAELIEEAKLLGD